MLTPEQIKNLKPGDPLVIHGTFEEIDHEGDIWVKRQFSDSDYWVDPSCVSMPGEPEEKPKYDPCRLFKKGDRVRLKEWNGRCPALPEDWKFDNGLFKVHKDEKFNSSVEITRENLKTVYIAPICFLELVTPVEELEPYKLIDSPNTYNIVRDSAMVMTIHKQSHPNAKAAAEAERDRLNAEYRKEQK